MKKSPICSFMVLLVVAIFFASACNNSTNDIEYFTNPIIEQPSYKTDAEITEIVSTQLASDPDFHWISKEMKTLMMVFQVKMESLTDKEKEKFYLEVTSDFKSLANDKDTKKHEKLLMKLGIQSSSHFDKYMNNFGKRLLSAANKVTTLRNGGSIIVTEATSPQDGFVEITIQDIISSPASYTPENYSCPMLDCMWDAMIGNMFGTGAGSIAVKGTAISTALVSAWATGAATVFYQGFFGSCSNMKPCRVAKSNYQK